MTKFSKAIILATSFLGQTACIQNSDKANSCYSDKLRNDEKVFTEMINKPHFKGGHDSLVSFLSDNIEFENFMEELSPNVRNFNDTARVAFIVSAEGGLSDLSVGMTKRKQFADEITRVIKKSSCNWVGGRTERLVNGWHRFDIYFAVDKPSEKEVKTRMTINEL